MDWGASTLKFVFLSAPSSQSSKNYQDIEKDFLKKISFFIPCASLQARGQKISRAAAPAKRLSDSNALLKELNPRDFVVLFDEKGVSYNSIAFSKHIERWMNTGSQRLVFVVGGAYGVDGSLQSRANALISLSAMTWNHQIANLMALEQVYRALTLLKNHPYHNA